MSDIKEDIKRIKEFIHETAIYYIGMPSALTNMLNELERLQKENKKLILDNLEYRRIQNIFDERTYRKKYLEERRKEEPNLLYPDADEIYKRYYELKRENEKLKRLHINIQGMRNGKELLNKYITDSIPKSVIQDKIEKLIEELNKEKCDMRYDKYDIQEILKELLNKGE